LKLSRFKQLSNTFCCKNTTTFANALKIDEVELSLHTGAVARYSEKVPSPKRSVSNASSTITEPSRRLKNIIEHCLASALCVVTLYAVLIVMSECVGCFVEILVFTLMGIIVNAGTLLKYVALVVMLIVYSYDCFNNVEKKYLKLNRALFAEVRVYG